MSLEAIEVKFNDNFFEYAILHMTLVLEHKQQQVIN
jgi:hypothetical protein